MSNEPEWYALRAVKSETVHSAVGERSWSRITPEGVQAVLDTGADPVVVALDVLAVIGKQTPHGVEDRSLCAYLAYVALRKHVTPDAGGGDA